MNPPHFDFAIIGGGIVGLATAWTLTRRNPPPSVVVLEKENRLAAHQTGNNSGVIHSGIYYRPGSHKAHNCVRGRLALCLFCRERGIPHEICGKVIVATCDEELPILRELERRGHANGLKGIRRLTPAEIREHEPHAMGVEGLLVPETGIVDFPAVVEAFAKEVTLAGGETLINSPAVAISTHSHEIIVATPQREIRTRVLINCAGLHSDRVARMSGLRPGLQIIPFRGEYYELTATAASLVRNLIYPVPDPRFPFLGVHFTRMIHGGVEAGPNAVLTLKREGYRRWSFSARDAFGIVSSRGLWRMMSRHWRAGLSELRRSMSRHAFLNSLQRLVPELGPGDIIPGGSGVRAQALLPSGELLDDFHFAEGDRMLHVLNAPSPAATASLSIGETIAAKALEKLEAGR